MLRIPAEFTVQRSEACLVELQRHPSDNDLLVPTRVKHAHLGGDAAFAQTIITWAANRSRRSLLSYAISNNQELELVARLHGLVSVILAGQIESYPERRNITDSIKHAALERLDQMQGVDPVRSRGMAFDVLCADHLGRNSPALFYRRSSGGDAQIRAANEFAVAARRLFRATLPQVHSSLPEPDDYEAIGGLIYEVFKNTEDHALSDHLGNRLKFSIRGITFRHHLISVSELAQRTQGMAGLAAFAARVRLPYPGAEKLQLIEISIFDSGPGYASRALSKNVVEMTPTEEHEAVTNCFKKNVTSVRDVRYGKGLPLVIDLLRRYKGFVRLRTGRLSLYADMSTDANPGVEIELRDVAGETLPILRAPAQGVLATFMLPIYVS